MKYDDYEIGQRVQVSDGRERPPDRFNRKLADWKRRNYTGHVHETREPRSYEPHGALVLKRDDFPDGGMMTFTFHIPLGGHLTVTPIDDGKRRAR